MHWTTKNVVWKPPCMHWTSCQAEEDGPLNSTDSIPILDQCVTALVQFKRENVCKLPQSFTRVPYATNGFEMMWLVLLREISTNCFSQWSGEIVEYTAESFKSFQPIMTYLVTTIVSDSRGSFKCIQVWNSTRLTLCESESRERKQTWVIRDEMLLVMF